MASSPSHADSDSARPGASPRNDGKAGKKDDGDLQYGEWIAAKRAYRASAEEREGLENRVRRLREEQRSMEATIANAKDRIAAIDDARRFSRNRKAERESRQRELERERAELRQRAQTSRQERARSIASPLDPFPRVRASALVVRAAAEEQQQLARRREAIRQMQTEALEERRKYLANRKRELQQANARHGKRVTEEKAENVRVSSELLLVEADLLRNLVELKREARKQTGALAQRVTGKKPPPRAADMDADSAIPEDGGASERDDEEDYDEDHAA
eukprot:CAMPEP_0174880144 /NCGR_PEP_ID=MMETSP1114-20130205/83615_1 /TAXON_ID=312471 /ORGANISM="Neobodo designis, Strain CCAP 1951/1" /LENGTH=275 /DNA_ID=CAMNT_0016115539 /DNA_START=66 /DNA_END=890 /DNA_ORIENTATION=-